MTTYVWRGAVDDRALGELHAEAFEHAYVDIGWSAQLKGHSLGWVTAHDDGHDDPVGFVNVAWDGGVHAFVLDTMVARAVRGRGIGRGLVARAASGARHAHCEWLHVDYEPELEPFYAACGFEPTPAGLVRLR
ncbi:GCN5-related protein N-acetyltransferase [Beutenbergia cavernae DSM 12333]|uniref:GCN5-related protein N-acetyltransferase n=1 Tax=Beutenbergia cavernae (strain ATCC BAA-8 / DSM 12333 / CCUG 43141 / JCM 11478 / NBRC 16432 / NCIMB 13614 / HKI 0122) TaxID=471853 RepID=C5C3T6_BEUC1|nr:GNAT family N-acetyltransferase [Beutenbergia cavernae]ACQ81995.1 GCN5-related protein N-acetyltransferase [Beutenbergia cavernae DSM 12333]